MAIEIDWELTRHGRLWIPRHQIVSYIMLRVAERCCLIIPHRTRYIMQTISVGHTDTLTIQYLDQVGNPMLTPVSPDVPPSWTNNPNPAGADTLSVSADGTEAVVMGVAAGSDTIMLSVVVSGAAYTAIDNITISAIPQVVSGVQIVDNVDTAVPPSAAPVKAAATAPKK